MGNKTPGGKTHKDKVSKNKPKRETVKGGLRQSVPMDGPIGCILTNCKELGGGEFGTKIALSTYCMSVWPHGKLPQPGDFWLPQGSVDGHLISELRTVLQKGERIAKYNTWTCSAN